MGSDLRCDDPLDMVGDLRHVAQPRKCRAEDKASGLTAWEDLERRHDGAVHHDLVAVGCAGDDSLDEISDVTAIRPHDDIVGPPHGLAHTRRRANASTFWRPVSARHVPQTGEGGCRHRGGCRQGAALPGCGLGLAVRSRFESLRRFATLNKVGRRLGTASSCGRVDTAIRGSLSRAVALASWVPLSSRGRAASRPFCASVALTTTSCAAAEGEARRHSR
jgi:hypothetical protein